MCNMKKLIALVLALALVLMAVSALAVDAGEGGPASITVLNALKGAKYSVIRVFNATYNTTTGTIAYTYNGTLTENDYFEQDAATGAITVKAAGRDASTGKLTAAAASWLKDTLGGTTVVDQYEATADGALEFTGLEYGYYVITSTQGNGSVLTVDSTNPNAQVNDKNTTTITVSKDVDDANVKIGQTVNYTVTFNAPNYLGEELVTKYTIEDTLPSFLSSVTVTDLLVGTTSIKADANVTGVSTFGTGKKIEISWVDGTTPRYASNSTITLTYSAVVTDTVDVTATGNTNTVTITPTTTNGDKEPRQDTETIYSYVFGLKKVNDGGTALQGATFQLPFYVKQVGSSNVYKYAGTTESAGAVNTVTTPDGGAIYIQGIATDEDAGGASTTFSITETVAPAGYNKLSSSFDVVATTERTTTVTKYYDANGKLTDTVTQTTGTETVPQAVSGFKFVINRAGTELPSTGGIGTTIFYILGGLLVVGAAVILVARRKASN